MKQISKYKTDLGFQRKDFEIPERPNEEKNFEVWPNGRIVLVHPRLPVKSKHCKY